MEWGVGAPSPVTGEVWGGCIAAAGDPRPIGVFDSGLGGLTVARAIHHTLPMESIFYVGDTARCPYGTRDADEVRSFVLQIGRWLTQRDVKAIVIACNTATASGLAAAQRAFDVPVLGVIVPGARAVVHSTRTRRVGVLATDLTVRSGAYARAIRDFDAGVEVFDCPASSFVDMVEGDLANLLGSSDAAAAPRWLDGGSDVFDTPAARAEVERVVAPLTGHGIDAVVLGCTHFPLLAGPIRAALGPGVRVVSSAEEVSHELVEVLARRGALAPAGPAPTHRFATTSVDKASFAAAGSFIFGESLEQVEYLDPSVLR